MSYQKIYHRICIARDTLGTNKLRVDTKAEIIDTCWSHFKAHNIFMRFHFRWHLANYTCASQSFMYKSVVEYAERLSAIFISLIIGRSEIIDVFMYAFHIILFKMCVGCYSDSLNCNEHFRTLIHRLGWHWLAHTIRIAVQSNHEYWRISLEFHFKIKSWFPLTDPGYGRMFNANLQRMQRSGWRHLVASENGQGNAGQNKRIHRSMEESGTTYLIYLIYWFCSKT